MGCLFSHSHISPTPEVCVICFSRDSLRVYGSTIWPVTEPESVCKMHRGSSIPAQGEWHLSGHVHRQLACDGFLLAGDGTSHRCLTQHLEDLGSQVNFEKRIMTPAQRITFIVLSQDSQYGYVELAVFYPPLFSSEENGRLHTLCPVLALRIYLDIYLE